MPVVAPLMYAAYAHTQQNRHSRYGRPAYPMVVTATVVFMSALYLLSVHHEIPLDQEHYRFKAQKRGATVEEFRDKESKVIEAYYLPYTRFFARRYLEKECQKLTLWKQTDK